MPQTFDVSREGPFDAYYSPMDTGDSPLVTIILQFVTSQHGMSFAMLALGMGRVVFPSE